MTAFYNQKSNKTSGLHHLFGITPPHISGLHYPDLRDYTTICFGITLSHKGLDTTDNILKTKILKPI